MDVTIFDIIGLIGAALSIYCFARLQWRRNYARHMSYSVLNFTSAILIGSSLLVKWNLPAFTINAAWGVISLYGMYRCSNYVRREHYATHAHLARVQKLRDKPAAKSGKN